MYNNNPYEEYMRNSLGYNGGPFINMNPNNYIYEDENFITYNQLNIDNMYPEIYRIIYPMVCKACMNVSENISEDLVSRITNEIYLNLENCETVQENRNTQPNNITVQNNKNNKTDMTNNRVSSNTNSTSNTINVRQENRNRNPLLRDLIRILVLRELLGNQGRPRPPFRPPFGGGFNQF